MKKLKDTQYRCSAREIVMNKQTEGTVFVVEIPHQLPARVYEVARSEVIEMAGRLNDNFQGDSFDEAVESIGSDRHTFTYFETFAELKEWCHRYAAKNGHQSARVIGQIETLAR